ncbi:OmpA family protein [Albirhodobacter sp. R86504]|uniref:OmpA family protein n=1 Tax=Albirhodobacter sp. R86504 TaxID=3093848 RepID=UPI003670768B
MKRFIQSTAVLSVAFMHASPWALTAQTLPEAGTAQVESAAPTCDPAPCPPENDALTADPTLGAQAAKEAEAEAKARADAQAAKDAEAEAKAQADAQAAKDAEAEAKAQANAQAAKDAEAEAKAQADAQAAKDANAEAKAQADAQAAKDAEAEAKAQADAQAAKDANAEAKAQADAQAAKDAEAEAKAQADAQAAKDAEGEAQADAKAAPQEPFIDPNAGLKTADERLDPDAAPVDAPIVSEAEKDALSNLLTLGASPDRGATAGAQPVAAGDAARDASDAPQAVTATTQTVTADDIRSATEEYEAAPQTVAPGQKNRLSNLEKAGLLGLGALVVGSILKNNSEAAAADENSQQVVSNTGDRVVVRHPDGTYQVFKDDDALLRRPGSTLNTETYRDGSTRTVVDREDGSQITTLRDATGRVLQRTRIDPRGRETVFFDDLAPETEVVTTSLPQPRARPLVIDARNDDAALKAALAQREIEKLGRSFSLRQVRDIAPLRQLAAMIGVDNVTFTSGSSALSTAQVDALADLGEVMQKMLAANPSEVFLIEGHTDATGNAAMNLALSDRRAETVALALTQYFDVPPENMVVQGYGETELLIDTQENEERNRRVAVRIITPLL